VGDEPRKRRAKLVEKTAVSMYKKGMELPLLQEFEKIKHGIDIVRVILVKQSILFHSGYDGVFADTHVRSPFL